MIGIHFTFITKIPGDTLLTKKNSRISLHRKDIDQT